MKATAGPEAVELAASAGLLLDPWQAECLDLILAERPDGRWASFETAVIVPRQNGKGSILEAIELAGLFLLGERLILHSAHEFKTAAEAFLRVLSLIQQTPDLDRLVHKVKTAHGDEGIELKSGQRLRFVARSRGSGRGFTGDRVILDEAYNLSDKALAALLPTMSARPNPQLVYTSSAPLDTDESLVLRRVCRRGREGARGLAYIEYAAAKDADLDDRAARREANPGPRVSDEFMDAERGAMSDEDFARERMGVWLDDDDVAHVIPVVAWRACQDETHRPAGECAYALDVAPDGRWAAIGASDGRHLEVVKYDKGTGWVVDACVAKRDVFGELVVDPASPAGALIEPLERAEIKVRQVSTRDAAAACGAFLAAVEDQTVAHLAQPELDAAVWNASRRDVGDGGWLWSRKKSTVDISPLVAVTLARWAAPQVERCPSLSVF